MEKRYHQKSSTVITITNYRYRYFHYESECIVILPIVMRMEELYKILKKTYLIIIKFIHCTRPLRYRIVNC